ncbi:MAG TPA: hypothetical protein VMW19_09400 [Myxococcota bacterium]|nr:hypothetical protein [Myxococcota bacterium]
MSRAPASLWLIGPAADLLFGCGLLYIFVFAAFMGFGESLRAAQPAYLVPILLTLLSLPHYGATLVRVYEQRADRHRYALFAVWATLAVVAVFVLSVYDRLVASLFLTVYLTWSPWHYTGQNYGLAVMFLRRAGISLEPPLKRWLHASFVLSYALVFLSFHKEAGPGVPQFNAALGGGTAIAFWPIGIPTRVADAAFAIALSLYLVTLGLCAVSLLRLVPARRLLPAGLLVLTQALWFSIPIAFRLASAHSGITPIDFYGGVLDWVALGHATQYLWVTSYYARASPTWHGAAAYFGKVAVAGIAIWTLPVLLFSPDLLGPASSVAAVSMLVATAVNVHHFILDGAIWKLRDGRIASVLLRAVPASARAAEPRSWLRRGVWATAAAWVVLYLFGSVDLALRRGRHPGDLAGMRDAVARLRWLGLDDSATHVALGVDAGSRGDLEGARREFLRSLELQESSRGWVGLAHAEFHQGHREAAHAALLHAVNTEPNDPETWSQASSVWAALGDVSRAHAALVRAIELAPERGELAQRLRAIDSQAAAQVELPAN